jgi:hypothetical protein
MSLLFGLLSPVSSTLCLICLSPIIFPLYCLSYHSPNLYLISVLLFSLYALFIPLSLPICIFCVPPPPKLMLFLFYCT